MKHTNHDTNYDPDCHHYGRKDERNDPWLKEDGEDDNDYGGNHDGGSHDDGGSMLQ